MKKLTKKIKELDKGEIAKIILKTLFAVGATITIIALPGVAHISRLFDKDKKYKYRYNKSLKSLEKRGYIKSYEKGGEVVVEITKEGKKKVLKYDFDELEIKKPKRWDGKWRIVMFDVPEKFKFGRESIRMKLYDMGFIQYQKSVFIHPYDCRNEIDFISTYFSITGYVKYIVVEQIEDDRRFKGIFKLT